MLRKLSILALAPALAAQGPEIEFVRTERDWPQLITTSSSGETFTYSGTTTAMAIDRFVPGHPGRTVVFVRNGTLYMSFQPAAFQHFTGVSKPGPLMLDPGNDNDNIGSLPQFAGGASRLGVLRPDGFDVWEYDPTTGFVSVLQAPAAAYAGATNLRTGVHATGTTFENHFIAFNDQWVQGGIVMQDDTIIPGQRVDAPAGQVVHDAVPIQWVAGGLPEIAVLLTNGFFVLDVLGNVLDSHAFAGPIADGKLSAMELGGTPSLSAVVDSGANWRSRTWKKGETATHDSATFSLPGGLHGLQRGDLDGDGIDDLVLSSTDSLRPVLFGTSNGPTLSNAVQVRDINAAATVLPGIQNAAGLLLDDVDRNGTLDFIVQSDVTNELVVQTNVMQQTQEALSLPVYSVLANELQNLETLFQMDRPSLATTNFQFPNNKDGLAVRFTLPGGLAPGATIQVFTYPILSDAFTPVANGSYQSVLQNTAQGTIVDVMIPVDRHATMVTGEASELLIELMVIEPLPDGPGASTKSTVAKYTLHGGNVPSVPYVVNNMVDPDDPLWFVKGVNDIENWGLMVSSSLSVSFDPNGDTIDSSRYIGTLEVTEDMPANVQPPSGKSATTIPSTEPL